MNTAVFLDRDGTIIEDCAYIDHPDKVQLIDGVTQAIRRFHQLGHKVIIVSNQSGVARGIFTEEMLGRVHQRMIELLSEEDCELDGAYYCPFLDGEEALVAQFRKDSDWRKPKPGMLLQAAKDFDLSLPHCWMIGDAPRDAQAGRAVGCQTILINRNRSSINDPLPTKSKLLTESAPTKETSIGDYIVDSIAAAAQIIAQK